jgi:N-methylhydantoinase B/oxoprolinase/acetone carboxylase alpha subunit
LHSPRFGGVGQHRGGDGILREIEFLVPLRVSVVANRRVTAPYGMAGGGDGAPGITWRLREQPERLPAAVSYEAAAQKRIIIETPGGGAWGSASS